MKKQTNETLTPRITPVVVLIILAILFATMVRAQEPKRWMIHRAGQPAQSPREYVHTYTPENCKHIWTLEYISETYRPERHIVCIRCFTRNIVPVLTGTLQSPRIDSLVQIYYHKPKAKTK
jgi:hypothetical protein